MSEDRISKYLSRDLYTLEDESNPRGSAVNNIWPSTVLDQVFDDQSPTKKTLRQIIADLRQEIITGGAGNIKFPVTSVNGMTEDVVITPVTIGLGRVDNTRDIDKPLSTPQRQAVLDMISSYDFTADMSGFYDHIRDINNPHGVTLEQLDKNNELSKLINDNIMTHSVSTQSSIHPDIRRSLSQLWAYAETINNHIEDRISTFTESFSSHYADNNAHITLFNYKENLSNKIKSFSDTNTSYIYYPSTKAVVEYVEKKISDYDSTLPNFSNLVSDIIVIDDASQLPPASEDTFRKAYFIRHGETSLNEIAICKINPDRKTYSWDISNLGTYSKFNPKHFTDTINGLSLNISSVVDAILDENGALDTTLSNVLSGYYSKKDIDNMHLVNRINIVPGTMSGTIRYYVNDDLTTMSADVEVSGLKRLAYLEWITEREIVDQAVRGRHIISEAIEKRHIQKKSVNAERMICSNGKVLGNLNNSDDTAHEIDLPLLAERISQYPCNQHWSIPYYRWRVNMEYAFGDGSYGRRFRGHISVLPNTRITTELSDLITIPRYQILEAGGSWVYQSNPESWTIMGGSNITGHTFATITMDSRSLNLETISIGDRKDALYDIWVRYIKTSENHEYIEPADPVIG